MNKDDWGFEQPPNAATLTVRSVMNGESHILLVIHDREDDGWQFLPGREVEPDEVKLVALERVVRLDRSLLELVDLPPGWRAQRQSVSAPWVRSQTPSSFALENSV